MERFLGGDLGDTDSVNEDRSSEDFYEHLGAVQKPPPLRRRWNLAGSTACGGEFANRLAQSCRFAHTKKAWASAGFVESGGAANAAETTPPTVRRASATETNGDASSNCSILQGPYRETTVKNTLFKVCWIALFVVVAGCNGLFQKEPEATLRDCGGDQRRGRYVAARAERRIRPSGHQNVG